MASLPGNPVRLESIISLNSLSFKCFSQTTYIPVLFLVRIHQSLHFSSWTLLYICISLPAGIPYALHITCQALLVPLHCFQWRYPKLPPSMFHFPGN